MSHPGVESVELFYLLLVLLVFTLRIVLPDNDCLPTWLSQSRTMCLLRLSVHFPLIAHLSSLVHANLTKRNKIKIKL